MHKQHTYTADEGCGKMGQSRGPLHADLSSQCFRNSRQSATLAHPAHADWKANICQVASTIPPKLCLRVITYIYICIYNIHIYIRLGQTDTLHIP